MEDEFDLIRLKSMFDHWKTHPPQAEIVKSLAIAWGVEFKSAPVVKQEEKANNQNEGLLEALLAFGGPS